jgi:hypothetical protein
MKLLRYIPISFKVNSPECLLCKGPDASLLNKSLSLAAALGVPNLRTMLHVSCSASLVRL